MDYALLGAPIIFYFVLYIFGFGAITRFILVAILVALESIVYAFKVFAWLMELDCSTAEMQEIADTIVEGSEGFFKAQYSTIFPMSILIATALFFTYIFKDNSVIIKEMGGGVGDFSLAVFTSFTFLVGAACSALSGFAGMWVSVRANLRVASASTRCYNTAI